MREAMTPLQPGTTTEKRHSRWNFVSGVILSVGAEGDGCYQILTCEGGVINAKKPKDAIYDLKVGQAAMAKILSDDVHIAPERFPALPGWNQWIARVVLVDPGSYGRRVTAKVIGEPWTLMSTMSLMQIDRDLQTWDVVTLSIDPAGVTLIGGGGRKSPLRQRLLTQINQSDALLPSSLFTYR